MFEKDICQKKDNQELSPGCLRHYPSTFTTSSATFSEDCGF